VATRKQRRRREKEQRHEYEVVYVDEEGHEVEVEPDASPRAAQRAKPTPGKNAASGRMRRIDPPSWRRSIRRGLIFAPLFLGMILLLNGSRQSLAASVINTLVLLLVFVPFSYFLDKVFYRTYQKRLARAGGS
jgi:hypothetical protein